jgi:hypothetical protein
VTNRSKLIGELKAHTRGIHSQMRKARSSRASMVRGALRDEREKDDERDAKREGR